MKTFEIKCRVWAFATVTLEEESAELAQAKAERSLVTLDVEIETHTAEIESVQEVAELRFE